MIGYIFCRLFLSAIAIGLMAIALERSSYLSGSMISWLFLMTFAVIICTYVTLIVILRFRKLSEQSEQSARKLNEETISAFAKTSDNLRLIAEVLNKNASLMERLACMMNESNIEKNDVPE